MPESQLMSKAGSCRRPVHQCKQVVLPLLVALLVILHIALTGRALVPGSGLPSFPGSKKESASPGSFTPTEPVLGVQLYSFRNQLKEDAEGTLAKVKAMGFTEVEVAGYDFQSASEFRRMLDKAGLHAVALFAAYEKLRDDFESVVQDAKALDAKYVIVAWIPHRNDFTVQDCDRAIKHFNQWGSKLAQHGLRFAYHVHGYEFRPHGGGTLLDKMLVETNRDSVALELDVFWVVHPGGNPVALLEKYGSRIELMHLKDMRKGLKGDFSGHADVESNVTVGTGQIDFPAIIRAAKTAGVKYMFIEDESSRVMDQVPKSLAFLKKLLN